MATFDELKNRGFVQQLSDEKEIEAALNKDNTTFYVGFDPTADSMHVGHLLPIMAMAHLQKGGHKPIAIIGGGTTMIGDPSGKTEMRKILTKEEIDANGKKLLGQLKRYLDFSNDKALFVNNADWLIGLNYIDFLRDIGKYFRVNEMIKMEAYKLRLAREEGLSFLEFNYQLLQAYDYLQLFEKYNCRLQMGGDDQWGNILAGVDLIRKVKSENVYALTFPLLTTATGGKMGKTESGAVWLSADKTSPYEYYQYWINCDDRDVAKFLRIFTFLPLSEIDDLCKEGGEKIRHAKEVLAYEATKITHGQEEADKAQKAAKTLSFSASPSPSHEAYAELDIPSTSADRSELEKVRNLDLFVISGLENSAGSARKLIENSGAYINDEKVDPNIMNDRPVLDGNFIILRKGKKTYHKIIIR